MNDHDHLTALLGRLKLTALRDQLDSLIDNVGFFFLHAVVPMALGNSVVAR